MRSPPHITLHMPFKWSEKKKSKMRSSLTTFCKRAAPFNLRLNNFDVFAPKVVYVAVQPEPKLTSLQQNLCQMMAQKLAIYNANYRERKFHPHITIAFRDLRKARFFEAWDFYRDQRFEAEFEVNQLTLLKHNGTHWVQEMAFDLDH